MTETELQEIEKIIEQFPMLRSVSKLVSTVRELQRQVQERDKLLNDCMIIMDKGAKE